MKVNYPLSCIKCKPAFHLLFSEFHQLKCTFFYSNEAERQTDRKTERQRDTKTQRQKDRDRKNETQKDRRT